MAFHSMIGVREKYNYNLNHILSQLSHKVERFPVEHQQEGSFLVRTTVK